MKIGSKQGLTLDTFVSKAKEAKAGEAVVLSGKTKVKLSEQKGSLDGKACVVKEGDKKKNRASVDKFVEVLAKSHGDGAAARALSILGDDRDAGRPLTGAKIDAVMTAVKKENRAEVDAFIKEIGAGDKEFGGQKARLAETFLRGARESGAKLTPEIKKEVASLIDLEIGNIRDSNEGVLDARLDKASGTSEKLTTLLDAPQSKWISAKEGFGAHMNVDLRRTMMEKQIEERTDALAKELSGDKPDPTKGKPTSTDGKPVPTDGKPVPTGGDKPVGVTGKKPTDTGTVDVEPKQMKEITERNERLLDAELKNAGNLEKRLNILLGLKPENMLKAFSSNPLFGLMLTLLAAAIAERIKTILGEGGQSKPQGAPEGKKTDDVPQGGGKPPEDKKPEVVPEGGKKPPEVKKTEVVPEDGKKPPEVKKTEGTTGVGGPSKSGTAPLKVQAGMYEDGKGNLIRFPKVKVKQTDQLGDGIWMKDPKTGKQVLNLTNAQCKQDPGKNTCFFMSVMNGMVKSEEGRAYLASLVTQTPEGMLVSFPGDSIYPPRTVLVTPEDVARHRLAGTQSDNRPAALVALECAAGCYMRDVYNPNTDPGGPSAGRYYYGKMDEAEAMARGFGLVVDNSFQPAVFDSLRSGVDSAGTSSSMVIARRGMHFVSVAGNGKPGEPVPGFFDPYLEKHEQEEVKIIKNPKLRAEGLAVIEKIRHGMLEGMTFDFDVHDSLHGSVSSGFHVAMKDLFDGAVRDDQQRPVVGQDGRPQIKPEYTQFLKFNLPKAP